MAERVARELRACGKSVDIRHTEHCGHARELARSACGPPLRYDCVVACGGDGTIQQVASAIAEYGQRGDGSPPVLGVAPCGRCNDFGREFEIRSTVPSIMSALVGGEPREIDLGQVNGRVFCTVCTIGIDAEISSYVDQMRIPIKGTLAYLYAAVRVLMSYKAPKVQLHGDFGIVEQKVMLASTANTRSYGGAIELVPQADPTDGLLNICVIDRISRFRALQLIPTVLRKKHLKHPNVHFAETKEFTVTSDRPLEIWADGERIGSTPARIGIVPRAIRLLAPASAINGQVL